MTVLGEWDAGAFTPSVAVSLIIFHKAFHFSKLKCVNSYTISQLTAKGIFFSLVPLPFRRMETSKPLWTPVSDHPHKIKLSSCVLMDFLVFQFVPIAIGLVAGHHWEKPGFVFFTLDLQVLTDIGKIPPEPSFLQAELSHLSQSLLILEMVQALVIFATLFWSLSSMSMSLLLWGTQDWIQQSGCVSSMLSRGEGPASFQPAFPSIYLPYALSVCQWWYYERLLNALLRPTFALHSCTTWIISLHKAIRLVRHELSFINPCWLLQITLIFFGNGFWDYLVYHLNKNWGQADWSLAPWIFLHISVCHLNFSLSLSLSPIQQSYLIQCRTLFYCFAYIIFFKLNEQWIYLAPGHFQVSPS